MAQKQREPTIKVPIIENGKVVGYRIEHDSDWERKREEASLDFGKTRNRSIAESEANGTVGLKLNRTKLADPRLAEIKHYERRK